MLVLFQFWTALVLLGFGTSTAMADGSCVPTCVNRVQDQYFIELGCAAANQVGCLCPKQRFVDLIADCSKTCGATVDEIRQGLVGSNPDRFCISEAANVPAARVDASPSPSSPSTSPASTDSHSPSTPPPSTSSTPSPSPTSPTSTSPTSSPTSVSTSVLPTSTTSSAPITRSTSSSGTATSSHSGTSTAAAGETTPASSPAPASGISSGAAAGIGIGVAIVVVAVGIIAFCLLRNKKKQTGPRHSMDISKPLPGSGRTYPVRDEGERKHDSYGKYGNDIEMTSNRYEDMVPSQQPRTMV